ncbi:MAG: hypothetical protein WCC25_18560, partial [Candidatus Korobacteraceae bacterium]
MSQTPAQPKLQKYGIYWTYRGMRIAPEEVASLAMGQIGSVRELNLKEGSILENAYRFAVTAR